jgi:phage-related minor tail protein
MAEKLTQAVISIAGKLDPSVKKSADKATKSISKLKVAAIAGAAAIGTAAVAGAKKLLDLGAEFDSAYDTIRIGTGATGAALEGLKGDFEKVLAAVPTSTESAATAVADFNTRLDINGETLQKLSKQAIYLSEKLGAGELQGVIEKSSQSFRAFGVQEDKMAEKMDYLFKVSQKTGMGYEELAEKTSEFGATFQALGYDFESTSTLIGQMYKEGADLGGILGGLKGAMDTFAAEGLDAGKTLEGYIERVKNASTETEALAIASEAFGGDATVMVDAIRSGKLMTGALTAELVKSTESIEGAAKDTMSFAEKMQVLKNKMSVSLAPLGNSVFNSLDALMPLAEKGINALAKVVQKLGKSLPDIVPKISAVVQKIIDVVKKLVKTAAPIIKGIGDKFVETFNRVKPHIEKLVSKFAEAFNKAKPHIERIGSKLVEIFSKVAPVVQTIAGSIGEALPGAFDAIGVAVQFAMDNFDKFLPIIAGVTAALVAYKAITTAISAAKKIQTAVTTALTAAQTALTAVMNANPIGLVCLAIGALVAAGVALYKNWDKVKAKLSALWAGIKGIFSKVKGFVSGIFSGIAGVFSSILGKIKGAFEGAAGFFTSTAEKIKGIFSGIGEKIKSVFSSIPERIKGIFAGISGFFASAGENIKGFFAGIGETVKAFFSAIPEKIGGVFENIAGFFTTIGERIKGIFAGIGDAVNSFFSSIINRIAAIPENIAGIFAAIIEKVKGVFETMAGIFENIVDKIKGIFSGISETVQNVFSSILGIIKQPFNAIISIVNKVISAINSVGFTIPEWVPIVGGKAFSLNLPEIPMFARGGIATGPSIVGEGGFPEYVITTDPQYRERNINLLGQAADALGASTEIYNTTNTSATNNTRSSVNNSRSGGQIKIEFAPVINVTGSGGAEDILQAIRARLPEFVDMIQGAIMGEMEGAY